MDRNSKKYLAVLVLVLATLACSITGLQSQANTAKQTADALATEASGVVAQGNSLLETARAVETQHPGVLATAESIDTQGVPLLGTIQAVATNNPGLVQTAQAVIEKEIPTGEPPRDVPILNRSQAEGFIGSSQYIFYTSPSKYSDVLSFYQTEMPNNGWQYQESESHLFSNAAQLKYTKDNRVATINLSLNPLNNTTVVVIDISTT